MKILDCTLRDGGYYTNWDFEKGLVETYIEAMNELPVDYIEVGYRSSPKKEYLGEYFYCPTAVLEHIRNGSRKKLAIILNEKEVRPADIEDLLAPIVDLVDMVRLAIDPENLQKGIDLAQEVKQLGFEVACNLMYMSDWDKYDGFFDRLPQINGIADAFYMVDSFGGVYPHEVKQIMQDLRKKIDVPIGFHGHNNMELALINTLTAIEEGAGFVDSTITGMGRGAGNLRTELLLSVLNSQGKVDLDYNALTKVVDPLADLQKQYGWGPSLPYIVSGANSIHQKKVMEWVNKRFYSFNSIIRALDNESKGKDDNEKLPVINLKAQKQYPVALVVGGGPSAVKHAEAIDLFLERNPEIVVIHASSRNAMCFESVDNDQYFCLVGNEGYRLESVFGDAARAKGICILPPFPRKMGTYIPHQLEDQSYELESVTFTEILKDTHTALAIETAIALGAKKLYLVGYDGYAGKPMGSKEQELFAENEYLFEKAKQADLQLISLTATTYTLPEPDSVFAHIA